jgi:hypothetical protein
MRLRADQHILACHGLTAKQIEDALKTGRMVPDGALLKLLYVLLVFGLNMVHADFLA